MEVVEEKKRRVFLSPSLSSFAPSLVFTVQLFSSPFRFFCSGTPKRSVFFFSLREGCGGLPGSSCDPLRCKRSGAERSGKARADPKQERAHRREQPPVIARRPA